MLQGYLDESGTHHVQDGIFTLAGYVAPPNQWRAFTREWRRVLQDSGFNLLPSTKQRGRFHMEPFMHDPTWPESRKNDLLTTLATVISGRVSFGVAFSVFVKDYNDIVVAPAGRTPKKWAFRKPYSLAMRTWMEIIWSNRHRLNRMPGEKVSCVFDRQIEFEGRAKRLFLTWAAIADWGKIFGKIAFDNDDTAVPLDAADMLVYSTNLDLRQREEGAPGFFLLSHLHRANRLKLHLHNRASLREMMRVLVADGIATGIIDSEGQRTDKPLPSGPPPKHEQRRHRR